MYWTTKKPTKEGWYWFKKGKAEMIDYFEDKDLRSAFYEKLNIDFIAGPIPKPTKKRQVSREEK